MVDWLQFSLRAWGHLTPSKANANLLNAVKIVPGDPVVVEDSPGAPRVRLLSVSMEDFAHIDTKQDAGAQSEAFAAAIHNGLLQAAQWLGRQSVKEFEDLRSTGYVTDVFVGGWITDDQFDLDIPAEFLRACGLLGLAISVCTND